MHRAFQELSEDSADRDLSPLARAILLCFAGISTVVYAFYFDDSIPLWSLALAAGLSWWARRFSGNYSLIFLVLTVVTLFGAIDYAFDRIDRFL